MVCTYTEAGAPGRLVTSGAPDILAGSIFRAQAGSEAPARACAGSRRPAFCLAIAGPASRNSLLNTPVATLGEPRRGSTDILHEYFVPVEGVEPFPGRVPARDSGLGRRASSISPCAMSGAMTLAFSATAPGDQNRRRSCSFRPETDGGRGGGHARPDRAADRRGAGGRRLLLPALQTPRLDPSSCGAPIPRSRPSRRPSGVSIPRLMFRNQMWDRYFSEA